MAMLWFSSVNLRCGVVGVGGGFDTFDMIAFVLDASPRKLDSFVLMHTTSGGEWNCRISDTCHKMLNLSCFKHQDHPVLGTDCLKNTLFKPIAVMQTVKQGMATKECLKLRGLAAFGALLGGFWGLVATFSWAYKPTFTIRRLASLIQVTKYAYRGWKTVTLSGSCCRLSSHGLARDKSLGSNTCRGN